MADPLLDHLGAFNAQAAAVLGGRAVDRAGLTGFVSSRFDRFLNQLVASGPVDALLIAEALGGRPGFVWLAEEPTEAALAMFGMTASTAGPAGTADADVVEVRSQAELDRWHAVYCEVFGSDRRGRDEWRALHDALGPAGDESLALLLARVDGAPAATGSVFFHDGWAGLYCFTTLPSLRGRGLASALVHASHELARARGVERALLHATALGRPVYARAGYEEVRRLPVIVAG